MSYKMKTKCPYCGHDKVEVLGAESVAEVQPTEFAVICTNCKAQGPIAESVPAALNLWEKREYESAITKECDALRAELESKNKELAALLPQPVREGIYPWAVELEKVRQHANFWIEGGRKEEHKGHAILCVEQGVNSWKNACYAYAERNYKLREKLNVDNLANIIRIAQGYYVDIEIAKAGLLAEKIVAAILEG